MSVYSNVQITNAIKDGTIVCVPFNEKHVSEASLDFTLGHYFYKQEYSEDARVYNPFDKSDVDRYFKGPLEAMPHAQWCEENGFKLFDNIINCGFTGDGVSFCRSRNYKKIIAIYRLKI